MSENKYLTKREDYEKEFEQYFEENNLDIKKLKGLYRSSGKNFIAYQHPDEDGKVGLWEPMPVVLLITREGDKLNFEQTEYTKRYIGK